MTEQNNSESLNVLLGHALQVSEQEFRSPRNYTRQHQYKATSIPNQETRRQRALEQQKQRREQLVNKSRRLLTSHLEDDSEDDEAGMNVCPAKDKSQPSRTVRQELK
jgi:hypothetical protein